MRIAVLGGSFDPVHAGHLQIAKTALKKLPIDEVWFMPARRTPLKDGASASFDDRARMLKLALRPYRKMRLCTLENEWEDYSYTIRSVKELRRRYPNDTFCWLIGDDQARSFDAWKDSEELKRLIPFYVFSREEDTFTLPQGLQRVTMELKNVSSSDIRKGCKLYMLPDVVLDYIGKHGLYLDEIVREHMSEKRFLHSCSVATLCKELAAAHHLDSKPAWIMGITHDICKELPKAQADIWMQYHMPSCNDAPAIWHGYIGADYIRKHYHIYDKRIWEAVYHHVQGQGYGAYAKILYIADKLDPLRGYDSSKEIEISSNDLEKGFETVKQQQYAYLKKEGTI